MTELRKQHNEHNLDFSRDQYRGAVKWLCCLGIVAVVLSLILSYMFVNEQQANYYASTTSGDVVPLHSLSEPVITQDHMLRFSQLAVLAAYSLDFSNYQEQMKSAERYFTPGGWSKFQDALNNNGLLSQVEDKKLTLSAIVTDTPVVLDTTIYNGRLTWRVQMPVLISYGSASEKVRRHVIITMNIQRVPSLSAPQGIQVSDFMSEANGD